MSLLSAMLYLLLVLGTLLDLFSRFAGRKLPPGPTPLPIIGNIHQLAGGNPLRVLEKLSKSYGAIMTLRLGQATTVVVSSSSIARQILRERDNIFSNRPVPNAFHALDHYKYSVFWLPVGNRWRSIRKFYHSGLFSGNRLDNSRALRHEKVAELIDYVKSREETGTAIDVRRAGFVTSLNILSNTLFSVNLAKYEEQDDTTRELKEFREKSLQVAGSVNIVDFFPLLTYIDPQGIRRRMKFHIGKIRRFFNPLIGQKLELGRSRELKMTGNHDAMNILVKSLEDGMDKTQIEWLCLDLFLAGTSGISAALEWAMAELMRHPMVLKKAKEELELVVGKGNIVKESHIPDLPYLNSIVKETLRLHPTAPLVPRIADADVEINGYIIPKGTQVYINLLAIGRDSTTWTDPMSFIPERFMDSKIDLKGHDFELIPFGAGRRICPGMSLSLRTVPVMLGSLVNSCDWKLESGIGPEDVDMEEKFAVTFHKAQSLRIIPIHIN